MEQINDAVIHRLLDETSGNEQPGQASDQLQPETGYYLSNGLSPAQARFIVSFLSSSSVKDAAKDVGISVTQAHRWLDDPRFLRVFNEVQHKLFSFGLGQLQNLTLKSINVLEAELDGFQPRYRIRAAEILLQHSAHIQLVLGMEQKIVELEDTLARILERQGGVVEQQQPARSIRDYLQEAQ